MWLTNSAVSRLTGLSLKGQQREDTGLLLSAECKSINPISKNMLVKVPEIRCIVLKKSPSVILKCYSLGLLSYST